MESESTAAKNSFEIVNSAMESLKEKKTLNENDIQKVKLAYEDETSDLKLKLREGRKLKNNLEKAVAESNRIKNAKRKRNWLDIIFLD